MFLGVTGVRMEDQVGRVAVMELGMPHVAVIDEQNRERAVRNMRHRALAICQMGELHSAVLIGVNLGVLEQENHDLVSGVVVNVYLFAFVLIAASDTRNGKGGNGSETKCEQ